MAVYEKACSLKSINEIFNYLFSHAVIVRDVENEYWHEWVYEYEKHYIWFGYSKLSDKSYHIRLRSVKE